MDGELTINAPLVINGLLDFYRFMNSSQSGLATLVFLPLRAFVLAARWCGLVVFWGCVWLGALGWLLGAIWFVLGVLYFILTATGVIPPFVGFGAKQWWDGLTAFFYTPFFFVLVMASPLVWLWQIITYEFGVENLGLKVFGIILSCLVLWVFFKTANRILRRRKTGANCR